MRDFNKRGKFDKKDSRGFDRRGKFDRKDSRDFDRRDFGKPRFDKQMHEATCDECGKKCELPFKPRGDKPVYCNDCFRKDDKFESRKSEPRRDDHYKKDFGQNKNDFEQLNRKMDKILGILENIKMHHAATKEESKPEQPKVKAEKPKIEKKVEKKKPVTKKVVKKAAPKKSVKKAVKKTTETKAKKKK